MTGRWRHVTSRRRTNVPVTTIEHEKQLENPPLCEQLPVRDYLDNVVVRTNGAFVAGYELWGITSYFASDEERNQHKGMLAALLRYVRSPSMRLQIRFWTLEC